MRNHTAQGKTLRWLRARREYLALNEGAQRWSAPAFLLLAKKINEQNQTIEQGPAPDSGAPSLAPSLAVGITATKKLGGAVIRNRAKRRLRALAREALLAMGASGHTYIFIARPAILDRAMPLLVEDLRAGLKRLKLVDHEHAASPAS